MTDERIKEILAVVETMLRSPSVTVNYSRGVRWLNNYDTGYRQAEPTDGKTIEISVNGGAQEIEGGDLVGGERRAAIHWP